MVGRSRTSSRASKAISTRSTPCCSVRRKSSSQRSRPAKVSRAAKSMRTCSMPPSADPRRIAARVPHLRVGIVTDRTDWHARELTKALRDLGVATARVRLEACAFDTSSPSGLSLDSFERELPDAVFVRTMTGGTFEAVTMRLGILHALRELRVPVWNDARAIERCVDKSTTTFELARAAIDTPDTWTVQSPEAACAIVARESARGPLVLKPLFGSQGRGLRLIRTPDELPSSDSV